MAIQKKERALEDFSVDFRIYTDLELGEFNYRIQKYYKPHTIQNPMAEDFGKTYQILDWDELGIAYGAYVKRDGAFGMPYYLAARSDLHPTRYEQFLNLMKQWDDWKQRVGYGESKRLAELNKLAEEVPF